MLADETADAGRPRSSWPPPAQARPEIWIVDDSKLQGDMCRDALSEAYDVTVYDSGATLLEVLATREPPDLLIVDWHMPDLSGSEVCRFVRQTLNSASLPILMLTASGTNESLLDGLAAGANDFLRKPFLQTELNARVSALLRAAADHARLAIAEQRLRIEADFRERFMGMLAHDLRQPLNAIFMATTSLAKHLESSPQGRSIAIQLRAAERMRRMIAELLDFTRVRPETGMPIQRQESDFEATARAIVEEMRAAHPTRPFHIEASGPCHGSWDPDRLAQVCSNLISNAIEHSTPDTPVDVRLTCADGATVELVIANNGEPLTQDTLSQLFLPFRRGTSKASGGVGLGLYIVHQIVTAHGGTVTVRSEGGRTEFVVHLPRREEFALSPSTRPRGARSAGSSSSELTDQPAPEDFFASEAGVCVYVPVRDVAVRVHFETPDSPPAVSGPSSPSAERAMAIADAAFKKHRVHLARLFEQVSRAREERTGQT